MPSKHRPKTDTPENSKKRSAIRRIRALDPSPWRKSSQPLSTGVGAAARFAPSLNDLLCSPAKPTQTWNSSSASLSSGATLLIGESSDFFLLRPSMSKRCSSLIQARRRLRLRHRLLAIFIWSDRFSLITDLLAAGGTTITLLLHVSADWLR